MSSRDDLSGMKTPYKTGCLLRIKTSKGCFTGNMGKSHLCIIVITKHPTIIQTGFIHILRHFIRFVICNIR